MFHYVSSDIHFVLYWILDAVGKKIETVIVFYEKLNFKPTQFPNYIWYDLPGPSKTKIPFAPQPYSVFRNFNTAP